MTLAILLLALIVATCFIAYFADNLGKHLGKKRISLKMGRFSLRPRQTATLISMASSVAIMLFTLGFLLVANKSIRNALLRYDVEKRDANIQRKENQRLLSDLNKQRTALTNQIATNQKLAKAVVLQRSQAEAQLRAANTRLGGVRAMLASAQNAREAAVRGVAVAKAGEQTAISRARDAQARYAQTQNRFQSVQSQLGAAQNQFKNAQQSLKEESARVAQANLELRVVNARFGATSAQLQQAQSTLQLAREQQAAARTQLAQAQERLKKTELDFKEVESQVRATLAQYKSAIEDIDELKARRAQLQTELENKTQELKSYTQIALQIATGDVAIRLSDVFAEKTFLPGTSSRQAREELRDLLKRGREKIQNLQSPARTLTLVQPSAVAGSDNNFGLTEDEFLRDFAVDLSTLRVAASVRLVAARDHATSETNIFARLTLIVVRNIFPQDSVLAAADIDATASDGRIFNQLLALLNESEKRARARKVSPLLTAENQYFYAPGTNEQVFTALKAVQAKGGNVHVDLLAAEDVTSVDSVRVRFQITDQQLNP